MRQHARLALEAAKQLFRAAFAMVAASYAALQAQVEHALTRLGTLLQRQERVAHREADPALVVLPAAELAAIDRRVRLLRTVIALRSVLIRGDVAGVRLLVQEAEALGAQEPELRWKLEALASWKRNRHRSSNRRPITSASRSQQTDLRRRDEAIESGSLAARAATSTAVERTLMADGAQCTARAAYTAGIADARSDDARPGVSTTMATPSRPLARMQRGSAQ